LRSIAVFVERNAFEMSFFGFFDGFSRTEKDIKTRSPIFVSG